MSSHVIYPVEMNQTLTFATFNGLWITNGKLMCIFDWSLVEISFNLLSIMNWNSSTPTKHYDELK